MKNKIIILVLLSTLFGFLELQAQTDSTKLYSPKAGTVALGASANIANIFTNFGDGVKVPTLSLQLYVSKNTAFRATFGINNSDINEKFYVRDDAAYVLNPLDNKQVIDIKNEKLNSYNSSLAIQQFFGSSKLRGFIGLQAIYAASTSSSIYKYANPMSEMNSLPSSLAGAYSGNKRTLNINAGSSTNFGGGFLAGFEYFVLPRLAIGAEMSVNIVYSKKGQVYSTSESMLNADNITIVEAISPGSSGMEIKSLGYASKDMKEQIGIYVMYHF